MSYMRHLCQDSNLRCSINASANHDAARSFIWPRKAISVTIQYVVVSQTLLDLLSLFIGKTGYWLDFEVKYVAFEVRCFGYMTTWILPKEKFSYRMCNKCNATDRTQRNWPISMLVGTGAWHNNSSRLLEFESDTRVYRIHLFVSRHYGEVLQSSLWSINMEIPFCNGICHYCGESINFSFVINSYHVCLHRECDPNIRLEA